MKRLLVVVLFIIGIQLNIFGQGCPSALIVMQGLPCQITDPSHITWSIVKQGGTATETSTTDWVLDEDMISINPQELHAQSPFNKDGESVTISVTIKSTSDCAADYSGSVTIAYDMSGCLYNDGVGVFLNITLTPPAAPDPEITAPNLCKGASGNITITNVTDFSKYTLTVNPSAGITLGTLGATTSIQVANTAAAGAHTLTLTAKDGSAGPWTKQFTVNAGPTLAITPSLSNAGKGYICSGGSNNSSVTLTATNIANYNYQWSGAGTGTAATLNATAAGNYTVKVTPKNAGAGCPAEATITVEKLTAPSAPVIATPAKTDVCRKDGGKTTLTVNNANNSYTYNWSPSGTGKSLDVAHSGVPTSGQNYTVTANDGKCKSNASTAVKLTGHEVSVQAKINGAGSTATVPYNASATLTGTVTFTPTSGSTGATYTWSGGGGIATSGTDASDKTKATTNPLTTGGTYTLKVVDAYQCEASGNVVYTMQGGPLSVTLTDLYVCAGVKQQLSCNLSGGSGSATPTYKWSSSDGLTFDNANSATPKITTTTPGTYHVKVEVEKLPQKATSNEATITIGDQPELGTATVYKNGTALGSSDVILPGSVVDIQIQGIHLPNGTKYAWTDASHIVDSEGADHLSVTTKALTKGNPCVKLVVTNADNKCPDEQQVCLNVNGTEFTLAVQGNASVCEGSTTTLTAQTNGGVKPIKSYTWNCGAGLEYTLSADKASLTVKANTPVGTYNGSVEVEDSKGNTATQNFTVKVKPMPVFTAVPVSPQTVKAGNKVMLTASANPATTELKWAGTPADAQVGTAGTASINAGTFNAAGGAYPYTITATLDGCSIDSTILVNVVEKTADIVIAANNATICEGDMTNNKLSASATGGSGTLSYNWTVISGDLQLSTTFGNLVSVTGGSVGSHTVRVTVTDGGADPAPSQYKDITVNISRKPVINSIVVNNLTKGTTNVTTADYGDLLELVGTVDPNTATCTWSETGSDLQSANGSTVNTKPVSGMNTFTLTARSGDGCTATQSVTVTVKKPDTGGLLELSLERKCADSGEDMLLTMTPSGGTTYSFTLRNNKGLALDFDGAGPWTHPISLGDQDTYFVSDFKAFKNGLQVNPSQVIPMEIEALFHSTPVITIAEGNVVSVCEGDELSLKASSQLANTVYEWDNDVQNGQPFFPTASGVYTVTATSEQGCKSTSTVNVTMVPKPTVTITASDDDICLGESVTLTAGGAAEYLWNNDETGETITVQPNVGGTVTYIVTGTEAVNGCSQEAPVTINVNEPPMIVSTGRVERSIAIGKGVVFSVKSTGKNLKYQWKRWDGAAWFGLTDDNSSMPTIAGSQTDSLRLGDVPQSWDGAQFQCVVTNDCGTADTTFLLHVKECFEILDIEWDMCEGIRPEVDPDVQVDGWYCPGSRIGICARLVLDEDVEVDVDMRDAVFKWTVDGLRTDDGRWGEMVFISDSSKLSWIPPMMWQDNITVGLCAYIDGACDTLCKSYLRLKATPFADLAWKLRTSVDEPRMFCPGDTVTCWIDDPNQTAGLNPTYKWYNDIFDLSEEECPNNKVVSLENDNVVMVMGQQDTWVKVIMTPSPEICTREPQYLDTAFLRVKQIVEPKFSIWCEDTLACLNDEIYLEAQWENAGENPTFEWTRSIGYPYWNLGYAYNAKTILDNDDMWIKCILKPSDEVCFNQDTVFADAVQIKAIKDPKVYIFADLDGKVEGDEIVVESDITQMPVLNPTYIWYVNDLIAPETSEELISSSFHQGDKVQLGVRGERLCQNQVLSNILSIDFDGSSRDTLVVIYRGERIRDLNMFKPGDEACEFFIAENGYTGSAKVFMGIDGIFNYVPDPDFTGKEKVTYKVVNRYTGNVQIGYIYIQVKDKDRFFIPNIITPNNDGLNDTWKLDFLADYPEHQITVYNRNGKIVFRATNYQNDWDGTGKGNSGYVAYFNLANGIYTYVIELGNKEILKGWLEIRRDMNRGKYSR